MIIVDELYKTCSKHVMACARILIALAMLPLVSHAGKPVVLFKADTDSLIKSINDIAALAEHNYVSLLVKEDVEVRGDFTQRKSYHFLQLVTSAEGTRELGTYDVLYREGKDSVTINRARVIRPNGTSFDLPSVNIEYDMHLSQELEAGLQTENRFMRLNFPALQVGSIIELQYTIDTYRADIPGYGDMWIFASEHLTKQSISSVSYPISFPIYAQVNLFTGQTRVDTTAGRIHMTRIMNDIPAIHVEPGSPPPIHYAPWVAYSSFTNWQSFGRAVYEMLWHQQIYELFSAAERTYVESLAIDTANKLETLKKIYYGVQNDIRYLGLEIGIHTIQPHAAQFTCERRFGDCKDMSLLLIRLLRRANVKAYPALVATNDIRLSLDTSFADFSQFNHVIVYVPDVGGNHYWLDATLEFAPLEWIAPTIEGNDALILDGMNSRVVGIPMTGSETKLLSSKMKAYLDSSGSASIEQHLDVRGAYSVTYVKPVLRYASEVQAKGFINQLISRSNTSVTNINYTVQGVNGNDSLLTFDCTFTDGRYAKQAGNLLILDGRNFSEQFDVSGLADDRYTDIYNVNLPNYEWANELHLPPGYKVEYRSPDKQIDNEYFTYSYSAQISSDNVWVSRTGLLVKARLIPKDQYANYRSLVEALNAHSNESLVLKRIE